MLIEQLRAAFREMEEAGDPDERFARDEGSYCEVELRPGAKAEKLERKRDEISVGATKVNPDSEAVATVVYVPDTSLAVLEEIFRDHAEGPLSGKSKPPREDHVAPIEAIRRARMRSSWTDDPAALPETPHDTIWWEVWCQADRTAAVLAVFEQMEARIAEKEIRNPDSQRVFCLATTNRDRSGDRPSAWSACMDRAAVGLDSEAKAAGGAVCSAFPAATFRA